MDGILWFKFPAREFSWDTRFLKYYWTNFLLVSEVSVSPYQQMFYSNFFAIVGKHIFGKHNSILCTIEMRKAYLSITYDL